MKEPSRPLELRVLEPEKNRLTLSSIESKFQSELKRILFEKYENPDLITVCRKNKKKIGENEEIFFIEGVHSF